MISCYMLQVVDFADKVNSYVMNAVMFFKSMWSEVKCNAALFVGMSLYTPVPRLQLKYQCTTGFMLGNLPKEKAGLISKEHICEGNDVRFVNVRANR